jgi:hypothetical protein
LVATLAATVAIIPSADIVLDVARAANPNQYRAAVERLARLRANVATDEVFTLPPAAAPAQTPAGSADRTSSTTRPIEAGASAPSRRRLDAYGQFEAFVLQSFIQSMLPKNATNVFGQGSAGGFWRSMLAEKMGDELARSGQIGIARKLANGPVHSAQPATTVETNTVAPAPPPVRTPTNVEAPNPDATARTGVDVSPVEPSSERS